MGAPKLKWTSEEEAALKAGVSKYGVGKWSTILKDATFASVLRSRSNVDLKDKWRNLHVMSGSWGSRNRGRVVSKSIVPTPKHDDNTVASSIAIESVIEVIDTKPFSASSNTQMDVSSNKPIPSFDDLILEAITKLKEPRGSSRNAISSYMEERCVAPPNFERLLAVKLKALTEKGRLIKVKHHYRIAPSRLPSNGSGACLPLLSMDGKPEVEKNEIRTLTKAQVDAELEMMKNMSAEEAAEVAARAVAEAEAAIAEAERAARIAEEFEAEAEAAQCFADVASKALQQQTTIPV